MKEAIIATLILFTFLFVIPVIMHKALYVFAKITYKRAHKKPNIKEKQKATKQYELFLSKEQEKNYTLQEIQEIKAILGGI